ncbi:hypothetical protein PG991_015907 [Apiospora marii]|uniref:Uncharacterized protein n=1 Tax=Apiospora marii TaxID=335849 RepID=A0ABR1R0N8_9PEZI
MASSTRSASATSASAAPNSSTTSAADPAAASTTIQQHGAKMKTSADLNEFPPRVRQRFQRAKAYLDKVLLDSPAFASLDAAKQVFATEEIEALLRENIEDFMRNTAPHTRYPHVQAVLSACNSVFYWNEDEFGIRWTEDMFKIDAET